MLNVTRRISKETTVLTQRLFASVIKKPKLELTMRTPYRTIFENFSEFTRVYVNSLEG